MIYFAQALGTELVKIGFTAGDPAKRVSDLQTACPHKLMLLASIEGSEQDEGKWHKDFASDRTNGEWFRMSWRLCLAIARAEAAAASPVVPLTGCEMLLKADQKLVSLHFPCPKCRGKRAIEEGQCDECSGTGFMNSRHGIEAANESPIAMVNEKRHHIGEHDITYPALFCMACGGRIASTKDGNVYWMPGYDDGDDYFYATRWHVVFTHKKCNQLVSKYSSWMPLESFIAYLGRNLGMNVPSREADVIF